MRRVVHLARPRLKMRGAVMKSWLNSCAFALVAGCAAAACSTAAIAAQPCTNCGSSDNLTFGPSVVTLGPDGNVISTPGSASGGRSNCGHCGHTSEQEYLSRSCNDCLFNWGDEATDINALAPRFVPRNTFTVDAMFVGRDVFNDVSYQAIRPGGPVILDTDTDFPFEISSGVRAKASRGLMETLRLEGIYMGQLSWDKDASERDITPNSQGGFGNLTSPFSNFGVPVPVPGLDFNSLAMIAYTAELENFELNLLHRTGLLCCALETSFVCGVRYVRMNESFSYGTQTSLPGAVLALNTIDTQTENELLGGQLGLLSAYKITERCYLEFELKAALAQNIATQNTRYRNLNTATGDLFLGRSTTGAGEGNLAVVGDINLVLNHELNDAVTFRLGYYAMFMDGVAIAHENVPDDFGRLTLGPGYLNHNGSVAYHGPHVGFSASW